MYHVLSTVMLFISAVLIREDCYSQREVGQWVDHGGVLQSRLSLTQGGRTGG